MELFGTFPEKLAHFKDLKKNLPRLLEGLGSFFSFSSFEIVKFT
jgi:hypothetical protein